MSMWVRVRVDDYRLTTKIVRDYLKERFPGYPDKYFDVQPEPGKINFKVPGVSLEQKDKDAIYARRWSDDPFE